MDFTYTGVVTNVVDGDTVDAILDLGFNISHKVRMRLNFVNAPEMKGASKEAALVAKKFLEDKLYNKKSILVSHKKDKYGRWLVTIYSDTLYKSVNQELIDNGMAEKYE